MAIDYKINMMIYGAAELPADWVYRGKYMQGEIDHDPFAFACVRGGDRVILIDCGANSEDPVKQAIFNDPVYHCMDLMSTPQASLALIGVAPEDVTDCILTHAHMDHMGALELFPNAHFYLQKEELEGWEAVAADPMRAPALMPHCMDANDLVRARALVEEGRMTLVEGDVKDLLPGIDVYALYNCHSNVDQMVCVNTPDGPYLYVGDLCTREVHLTGMPGVFEHYGWQTGSSGSAFRALAAFPKALALVDGDIKHIMIPHEIGYAQTRETVGRDGNAAAYLIR